MLETALGTAIGVVLVAAVGTYLVLRIVRRWR